jgi:hypothetical protein
MIILDQIISLHCLKIRTGKHKDKHHVDSLERLLMRSFLHFVIGLPLTAVCMCNNVRDDAAIDRVV